VDTKKVTKEYRMSQWAQTIQQRRESGQNIKDFCQSTGISRNAYFYWQKKLREAACSELAEVNDSKSIAPSGWACLTENQTSASANSLTIEVSGCNISVNTRTDPQLLAKVCHELKSL
jgi:putative transposase